MDKCTAEMRQKFDAVNLSIKIIKLGVVNLSLFHRSFSFNRDTFKTQRREPFAFPPEFQGEGAFKVVELGVVVIIHDGYTCQRAVVWPMSSGW